LQQAGFNTQIPPATTDLMAKTTIRYPAGQESAAKALQAQVPGVVMVRTHDSSGVMLLLGNNGVQVKSLMSASHTPTGGQTSSSSASSSSSGSASVTTAADAGCIN